MAVCKRLSWSAPWWSPTPFLVWSRSRPPACPQLAPGRRKILGLDLNFSARADKVWGPHVCFLVDKICQLRQNDPCLLSSGDAGATWLVGVCSLSSLFMVSSVPRSWNLSPKILGAHCGRVSAAVGGKAPEIYQLFLKEQGPWKVQV